MSITAEQQHCIDSLDKLIAISAGAGAGKTFTLTERIFHAFQSGFIKDIEGVLAITFTEKAASELRSRIKLKLKSNGFKEQANKCDIAWISTIHGMCFHILKQHGIELGIDPGSKLISGDDRRNLMSDAVENVLRRKEMGSQFNVSNKLVSQMINEYKLVGFSDFDKVSVFSIVNNLAEIFLSSVNGFNSLKFYEAKKQPAELYEELKSLVKNVTEDLKNEPKISNSLANLQDEYLGFLKHCDNLNLSNLSYKYVVELCSSIKAPLQKGKKAGQYINNAREYKLHYMRILHESMLAHATRYMPVLVGLAKEVCEIYESEKRRACYFDNNDLIINCYKLLKKYPEITKIYKDKFKIIMVDEFQDTDLVQFEIIKMLAKKDMSNICTVGDSQQSIYRFRGADVDVYKNFVSNLLDENLLKLTVNFRSDQNILSFVEKIFAQDEAFGNDFLKLSEGRTLKKDFDRCKKYDSKQPRVQLHISSCQGRDVSKMDLVRVSARALTKRFIKYKDEGFKYSDFAVLLGSMRYCKIYEDELRRNGFPCVVAGGSVLSQSDEAHYMKALARVISNPYETEALYTVLASPMFAFNTQDFMQLCEGGKKLDQAFFDLAKNKAKDFESLNSKIYLFSKLVYKYAGKVQSLSMAKLMTDICVDCGLFMRFERLGVSGNAQAGNVLKIIRMVEIIENDFHINHLITANKLEAQLAYAKLSPGSISTEMSNFVKIMTVHASKGLEFPIVAVAELEGTNLNKSKLKTTRIAKNTYCYLAPGEILDDDNIKTSTDKKIKYESSEFADITKSDISDDIQNWEVQGEYLSDYANNIDYFEEISKAEEAQRILYVALTRAEEAVALYLVGSYAQNREGLFKKGSLSEIVTSALFEVNDDFKKTRVKNFEFGGTEPGLLVHDFITKELKAEFFDIELKAKDKSEEFLLYKPQVEPQIELVNYKRVSPYYSYSRFAGNSSKFINDAKNIDKWNSAGSELEENFNHDKAANFGAAFHALMQYCATSSFLEELPSKQRIQLVAEHFELDIDSITRLKKLVNNFFASEFCKNIAGRYMRAEESFFVNFELNGCQKYLQGEIDLLLPVEDPSKIEFIDYKTGGKGIEKLDQLQAKYKLQAKLYAYALIKSGYGTVNAKFVEVEKLDDNNQPLVLEYNFTQENLTLDFDKLELDNA